MGVHRNIYEVEHFTSYLQEFVHLVARKYVHMSLFVLSLEQWHIYTSLASNIRLVRSTGQLVRIASCARHARPRDLSFPFSKLEASL
jgi:hypothetical protein